jgi:hypothetical protein
MSYKLDHPSIATWWGNILLYREKLGVIVETGHALNQPYRADHIPTPLFGNWRVRIQNIPSQECYNYLEACGYECNTNGEMLLSTKDKDQYLDFIKLMGITEEI